MNRLLVCVCIGVGLTGVGCSKQEPSTAPQSVTAPGKEPGNSVADAAKRERDEFIGKAEQVLAEAKGKMTTLKGKAAEASGDAKARIEQQVKALEDELKVVEQKLADLKSAGEEKWKELKVDVGSAVDHLKQSIESAKG